jgi:serine/threonine-protein kinase RsbW
LSVPADRTGPPNVRLNLSNRPENVTLVRQMLAGLADAIPLDHRDLADISIAVSEACNNVVLHAYDGEEGPLVTDVHLRSGEIEIVVRDHGDGIASPPSSTEESTGLGISVIEALAGRAEFRDSPGSGTEVRMSFAVPGVEESQVLVEEGPPQPATVEAEPASTMELLIAPAPLAGSILPRLLSVLAARANFRTDRIAELRVVADALTADVPRLINGTYLNIAVSVRPRDLEMRIAPLRSGQAARIMVDSARDGVSPAFGQLADEHRVLSLDSSSEAEMLAVRLVDRR